MSTVLLPFPAQRRLAEELAPLLGARLARLDWRRFPDGESLVAIDETLQGADAVLLSSLHQPDTLALALRFAAATAREFGARSVGLVAPYLAYMRQDRRFHPGDAISAPLFAAFLQEGVDWLVTVDPHLHRIDRLDRIFRIPTRHVAAAPAVAAWIRTEVAHPLLIGPDGESAQWVAHIAALAEAPFQVLHKERRGDRDVSVSLPDLAAAAGRNPVVVDDIVSSGHTVIETLGHLARLGMPAATVVAIHAVFAGDAYADLQAAGAARIVSCDSINHASNAIALAGLLAPACREHLGADLHAMARTPAW